VNYLTSTISLVDQPQIVAGKYNAGQPCYFTLDFSAGLKLVCVLW